MTATPHQSIVVQLFGAFRRVHDQPVTLSLGPNATAQEVKQALGVALLTLSPGFNDLDLLEKSVIADNHKVFAASDRIGESVTLAILPPVCGG